MLRVRSRARATSFSMHSAGTRRRGLLLICLVSSARGFGALCLVSSPRGFGGAVLSKQRAEKSTQNWNSFGLLLSILVSSEQKKINTPSGVCCDYSPDDASDLNVRLSGPSIEQRSADQPRPYRAPRGVALLQYDRLLAQRVEACATSTPRCRRTFSLTSLKTAPRSRPRTSGSLMPFQRASPLPAGVGTFPIARQPGALAICHGPTWRHGRRPPATRVPRDKARRPSREPHTDHGSQDWPWLYEDFRRKGVQAQPWEATLAADFEQAVTGPLRRALRRLGDLANFVRQLCPVAEIQFDPAEVETFLCEKLNLPRPQDAETLRITSRRTWTEPQPPFRGARPESAASTARTARRGTRSGHGFIACATEYTTTATMLRDRLDPDTGVASGRGPSLPRECWCRQASSTTRSSSGSHTPGPSIRPVRS